MPVEPALEFKLRDLVLNRPECEPTFPDHLEGVRGWGHVGKHGSATELREQLDIEIEEAGGGNNVP
jgi:hypothetical protein